MIKPLHAKLLCLMLPAVLLTAAPTAAQPPTSSTSPAKEVAPAQRPEQANRKERANRIERARRVEPPRRVQPTHADVTYGPHDRHRMDVWLASSDEPAPVLLSIHGGGFRGGNKGVDRRLLSKCLEAGISVVAITYRFSQDAIAPASFHDAARAVQFIREHAREWHLDPTRMAATGNSAGAGLSLWLALHDDLADPNHEESLRRQSTRLTCAVVFNGQTSYDPRFIRELFSDTDHYRHPALAQLFDVNLDELDELPPEKNQLFTEVSAMPHLSKDDVPVSLIYASKMDTPITNHGIAIHHPRFGRALKDKMDRLGIACEVHTGVDRGSGQYVDLTFQFIQRHLSDSHDKPKTDPPVADELRDAISRSVQLLEEGSKGSADQRTCFTCHSQALPVFALTEARRKGFQVDDENYQRQLEHTAAHLKRGRDNYQKGKGQGGGVDTAGYALWTLEAGEWETDETTGAVVEYLLQVKKDLPYWKCSSTRPPSEVSNFASTYVALRALSVFGQPQDADRIDERTKAAAKWLKSSELKDTEDRVFQLRSFEYVDVEESTVQQFAEDLLRQQRANGGWAQTPEMDSDAYATATVLVALWRSGRVSSRQPPFQRGLRYLLKTQKEDGSWHVTSRSRPFQTYFETGFPHGKDQFISTTATAWATIALLAGTPSQRDER